MDAREKEITDLRTWHGLTNALIIGAYLRFMADGESHLGRAWLDSSASFTQGHMPLRQSGAYSKNAREVVVLRLRAMSESNSRILRSKLQLVQQAVDEFSAERTDSSALEGVVLVEIGQVVDPSTEVRVEDVVRQATQLGPSWALKAEEFRASVATGSLGWSVYGRQRVQHLALPDARSAELEAANYFLQHLNAALWYNGKRSLESGEMNNISHASSFPGPALLADAAASVGAIARQKLQIGVIVPGGAAARSDVRDVEEHPEIEASVRVVPRGSRQLGSEMARAVSDLQAQCDAILIAYGGGEDTELRKIRGVLALHLEELTKPCWVAVGHTSDNMVVDNPLVRVCRTPGDARALLLAETIEQGRKLKRVLLNARVDEVGSRGDTSATARLHAALNSVEEEVEAARAQHLQQRP